MFTIFHFSFYLALSHTCPEVDGDILGQSILCCSLGMPSSFQCLRSVYLIEIFPKKHLLPYPRDDLASHCEMYTLDMLLAAPA